MSVDQGYRAFYLTISCLFRLICLSLALCGTLIGCASERMPYQMMKAHPDAMPLESPVSILEVPHTGHHVRVISIRNDSFSIVTGELLSITEDAVIVMSDAPMSGDHRGPLSESCPTLINAQDVNMIELTDTGHSVDYLQVAGSILGLTALTISNGFFALLSAPITLISGARWIIDLINEQSLTQRTGYEAFSRFARYPSSFDYSPFSECSIEDGLVTFNQPKEINLNNIRGRGIVTNYEFRLGLLSSYALQELAIKEGSSSANGFNSHLRAGLFFEGLYHITSRFSLSLSLQLASPLMSDITYKGFLGDEEKPWNGSLKQDISSYRFAVEFVALREDDFDMLINLCMTMDGIEISKDKVSTTNGVTGNCAGIGVRLNGPMKGHMINLQYNAPVDVYTFIADYTVLIKNPNYLTLRWGLVF